MDEKLLMRKNMIKNLENINNRTIAIGEYYKQYLPFMPDAVSENIENIIHDEHQDHEIQTKDDALCYLRYLFSQ